MREEKNEFLSLLCNMHIVALLVALPLYTGDGYGQLGITKYVFFRNVSVLCLGCWLILGMPGRIRALVEKRRMAVRDQGLSVARHRVKDAASRSKVGGSVEKIANRKQAGRWQGGAGSFSMVDCAVAAYGICVTLSALCSHYPLLSWFGYEEWYMGAFSQLMFVGIYFFVSRQYDGAAWPLWLGETAFFLVSGFGLLHKLGIDPLGLQKGWNSGDWVYGHMLSTLGNINWLCGFYSVALAFTMAHFLQEKRPWLQVFLYVSAVLAFVLLGVQGSQGGLLIIGVCVGTCLLFGWRQADILRKTFLLLTGFFLCMPLMELLMYLRGKEAAVVRDGNVFDKTVWYEWVMAALACIAFFIFFHKKGKKCQNEKIGEKGKPRKGRFLRVPIRKVLLVCIGLCAVLGCWVAFWRIDDSFGSGRGFLWRIAIESFGQADFKEKLLGAGPDCFGAAVFARLGAGTDVWKGDHWEGSVFTNAHNEILNQLCNVGILGTASYVAIFLTSLRRYRRALAGWLGLLAVAMYGAHSLLSFQQVLNAPLLFLALGLCEYKIRSRERGEDPDADVW